MKIVTLNTWGIDGPYEVRWQLIRNQLTLLEPDIVFLQEVFQPAFTELILKDSLFFSANAYPGGLLTLARFPIRNTLTITYQAKSPLEEYLRYLLLVETSVGTDQLLLANTHLSWKPDDKASRCAQVRELLAFVKERNLPTLLAGDFNDTPKSLALQQLTANGFIDLFAMIHPHDNAITWDNQNPYMNYHSVHLPDRRIDFILANHDFLSRQPIRSARVVFNQPNATGLYPSDHYGVLIETEH